MVWRENCHIFATEINSSWQPPENQQSGVKPRIGCWYSSSTQPRAKMAMNQKIYGLYTLRISGRSTFLTVHTWHSAYFTILKTVITTCVESWVMQEVSFILCLSCFNRSWFLTFNYSLLFIRKLGTFPGIEN